jgi:hypothetical protein
MSSIMTWCRYGDAGRECDSKGGTFDFPDFVFSIWRISNYFHRQEREYSIISIVALPRRLFPHPLSLQQLSRRQSSRGIRLEASSQDGDNLVDISIGEYVVSNESLAHRPSLIGTERVGEVCEGNCRQRRLW